MVSRLGSKATRHPLIHVRWNHGYQRFDTGCPQCRRAGHRSPGRSVTCPEGADPQWSGVSDLVLTAVRGRRTNTRARTERVSVAGYPEGSAAGGIQGLPVNRPRRASSLLMLHLAEVDRWDCTTAKSAAEYVLAPAEALVPAAPDDRPGRRRGAGLRCGSGRRPPRSRRGSGRRARPVPGPAEPGARHPGRGCAAIALRRRRRGGRQHRYPGSRRTRPVGERREPVRPQRRRSAERASRQGGCRSAPAWRWSSVSSSGAYAA
jgi:hypothetical protein